MGKQEKQSFVNLKTMKVVATPEELRTIMDDSKKNDSRGILENLDLSAVDFSKDLWNFDGWYIHNVAFSKLRPDTKERKTLFGLSFVGAYLRQVSFAQSNLIRCNFDTRDDGAISTYTSINNIVDTDTDLELLSYTPKSSSNNHYNIPEFKEFWNLTPFSKSKLEEVDFFLSELNMCRFRSTYVMAADFRYSHVKDCSMSEGNFFGSDFYFCNFEGATNFISSKFILCSFTNTVFENNCIRLINIPNGVLQDKPQLYSNLITNNPKWLRFNPCFNFSSLNHAETKRKKWESRQFLYNEAAELYKQLSGIYAGKGLNRDSNQAYKKAKQNEICYHFLGIWLSLKGCELFDSLKHFGKFFKNLITALFGFGYMWQAAVAWFVLLISVYGFIYNNKTQDGLEIAMSYSFNNSLGTFEKLGKIVGFFIASCQTALGMLLIGFLGFIMANNLRNDS